MRPLLSLVLAIISGVWQTAAKERFLGKILNREKGEELRTLVFVHCYEVIVIFLFCCIYLLFEDQNEDVNAMLCDSLTS